MNDYDDDDDDHDDQEEEEVVRQLSGRYQKAPKYSDQYVHYRCNEFLNDMGYS